MKKLLLSISVVIGLSGVAQTLTQANHAPAVGDPRYATYQCDSLGINAGSSGAGQLWTYNPTPRMSIINTYTTSASTNANYNPANVVVSAGSNNSSYYLGSATDLQYYGGVISVQNSPITFKYTSPAIYAVYPMSLNTTTTSLTSGSITITTPFPTTQSFTGTCTVLADATGTLSLPLRSFDDVIRVTTTQNVSAAGGAVTINLKYYDFYSVSASKAPVFSIQTSTVNSALGNSTQTIVVVQKDYDVVSVKENTKTIELSLYPNPATSFIELMTESKDVATVTVYDLSGKVVAKQAMETGKTKVNLEHLSAGNYMYSVTDKTNNTLKTGTFIINK